MASREVVLSTGEWAVLGVVGQGPTHGFAVAALLAEDGALGRVWTLPRPMVYQALKKLLQQGLISERATERSEQGPARTIVGVTPAGRAALRRWLTSPVEHVRDVRSLLMLKLALLDRYGQDPRPLLEAQRQRLVPQQAALERLRDEAEGFEWVMAQWRLASSQATVQFLDSVLAPPRALVVKAQGGDEESR